MDEQALYIYSTVVTVILTSWPVNVVSVMPTGPLLYHGLLRILLVKGLLGLILFTVCASGAYR